MKMRRVPTCFINLTALKLTGQMTWLHFNDFTSEPILLDNGTTQGDPDSMSLYGFFNAPSLKQLLPMTNFLQASLTTQ
jgi:hypothetical protein